jgi:NADPH-dependent 2,4-dienoyl-CoA reductase/sulfur reductase-like enzyme
LSHYAGIVSMTKIISLRQDGSRRRERQVLADARELASDQQLDVDACIVGAGPAGITVARS